jgi:outer membrane lipoprotein-sorting protein
VKADSVDLKGGAIVSTVTKDKNDLTTNRLTFSNIENEVSIMRLQFVWYFAQQCLVSFQL